MSVNGCSGTMEILLSKQVVITIDGPVGSGKSTIARTLAREIGFSFLDSGAIYRAATWFMMDREVDLSDPEGILSRLDDFDLELREGPSGMLVFVNSREVTSLIRGRDISNNIYHLADNAEVRARLIDCQRGFARGRKVVAEGRDMGTVIFPDADLKFYLHASLEVRARRRLNEFEAQGEKVDIETLKEEIRQRDSRDTSRKVAPLRRPEDSVEVDSSGLTVVQVIDFMRGEAARRGLC